MEFISYILKEQMEEYFGRGPGDPDVFGYPGEDDESPKIKHPTPAVYRKKHWSEIVRNPNSSFEPHEVGDNDPANPEQAGY